MKQFKSVFFLAAAIGASSWLSAQTHFNSVPSRIVGQPALQQTGLLTMVAPNLVEGKEFDGPESLALDTSTTPPIIYVADTGNNRVLAWKNASGFTTATVADLVIGQRDLYSVAPQGPTNPASVLSTGLSVPTAVAVDSTGNLYVADAGNNRILRYPAPFKQTSPLLAVDLIIGQVNLSSHSVNQGNSTPSATSLAFLNGNNPYRLGMALDASGNLWVADPGNNRVLRFPAGNLTPGNNAPAADIVLGQSDFMTGTVPAGSVLTGKTFLNVPSGLAFDPKGRLFVADQGNPGRVLVYQPPFSVGEAASRIMGEIPPTQTNPNPPSISAGTLGGTGGPPEGIFFVGSTPYVVDTGNARILQFMPYDQWPMESTSFSPVATAVIGQSDFVSNKSNQGMPQPSSSSFSGPIGAHAGSIESAGVVAGAFAGTDLFIVDAGNNRVMVFPQSSSGNFTVANRLLGQDGFAYNSINLIEGREFYFAGGASVIDWNSTPPHLYVSDPGNNRVLAFADYRKVAPGVTADLVIGQPDFKTAEVNYPKNDPNQLNSEGLYAPQGLALDSNGNLWVADNGNGRVLRFPTPFAQTPSGLPQANLVIGQSSFYEKITDASSQNMSAPYGIAFTALGHLLVSDTALDRVLFFLKPTGGDFTNGQLAYNVIGQPNYGPASEPAGSRQLSSPRLIAVDQDDKLYVADQGNGRIVIYFQVPTLGIDPLPSLSLTGLNNPFGVFTDKNTGEVWVADTINNRVLRYPKFSNISDVGTVAFDVTIPSNGPYAVTVDPFDNPVVVEGAANRVAFFYQQIGSGGNAANYFQIFAPGMLASIFAAQSSYFGLQMASASSVPLPTTLGGVQVLVGGTPAPLLYTSQSQINFQVPYTVPAGSTPVEFQVTNPSTGQIIASNFFRIDQFAPGLFTADGSGSNQLAALNQDNTVNSQTNPAKAGSIIQLFGTGVGDVTGAPPSGSAAPSELLPTSDTPIVYINGMQVPVSYSGLAPGFIGLWQINAQIPASAPTPDQPVPVAVLYQGINTRLDALGNSRLTYIRTTP
jgi:uncharacterized protein (TIGR03437 family)